LVQSATPLNQEMILLARKQLTCELDKVRADVHGAYLSGIALDWRGVLRWGYAGGLVCAAGRSGGADRGRTTGAVPGPNHRRDR
jgi:hypothetical protein